MILQHFKDLTEISGVEAIIVFDNRNNILDSWAVPKYNQTIFSEIGESFLHIFGLIEYLQYDVDELSIPFDRGVIYTRIHPRFYLVLVARLSVELSLLRIATNVAMKEFLEQRKVKKMLKKLTDNKFLQIKSVTLDDVEKIMLENILEDKERSSR